MKPDRITSHGARLSGQLCVRKLRLTVQRVVELADSDTGVPLSLGTAQQAIQVPRPDLGSSTGVSGEPETPVLLPAAP